MKILHINTATTGGAATAALRIHHGLFNQGFDSHFLSLASSYKYIPNHHVYNGGLKQTKPTYPILTLKNWLKEKFFHSYSKSLNEFNKEQNEKAKYKKSVIKNGYHTFSLFSYPDSLYDITELEIYKQADVIHLHWVAGFLDYPSFFKKNKKPIVWTFHDMNPIMGGFHYQNDSISNKVSHGIEEKRLVYLKKEAYANAINLNIVSPSNWLAEATRKSELLGSRSVQTIRYRVDLNVFKNRDMVGMRHLLNIPIDKKVYLIASQDLNDSRKGIDLVLPIIEHSEMQDVIFLLAGYNFKGRQYPNVIALGGITDELLMSCVYNAADYFILSSREDNLPNTMLESIASGTPIIAFNIGDNKEIIEANNCGIICEEISSESLLEGIQLSKTKLFNASTLHQVAIDLFEERKISKQYKEVYEKLL